jgi:hypothetical protein
MPSCAQVSPASGDERIARRATAPSSHDTPSRHFVWRRCGAAHARSSTPPGRAGERSPVWNSPAREEARSPLAQPTRDIVRRAAFPKGQTSLVACRLPPGTILFRQPATRRPQRQHPRLPYLPRSPPRTVVAHRVPLPTVDRVTAMAPVQTDPNAAFECSSQPPPSRCCDDRLDPPWLPRSL